MRSVRVRLSLLFAVVCTVILGIFAATLYAWWGEVLDRQLTRGLDRKIRFFGDYLLEEIEESRTGIVVDYQKELANFLEITEAFAAVRRSDGSILFVSKGYAPIWGAASFRQVVRGSWLRGLSSRLVAPSGETFDISFAVDEEPVWHELYHLRLFFTLFCPVAILISGVLGYLFIRRALAPVEILRRHAERISRSNLNDRVPLPGSTGEFRNLAWTFNDMLDRLDRAFQDSQHFASDAAHELRTPLATLRAEIETAVQTRHSPEEYEGILGSMAEEINRMTRLVSDLLALTRIDLRQYPLRCEPVDLVRLLGDLRETWLPVAVCRGIDIALEGGPAVIPGNPESLRRVFMNLLENAIKYNRDGGRVTVSLAAEDGWTCVRIRDTGIGIASEHHPRLFQRFYRVDPSRSREGGGAGLGLAICRALVTAHGGEIGVESVPGTGSTFTVRLPTRPHPVSMGATPAADGI